MTRQANILSFDEVKAYEASAVRSARTSRGAAKSRAASSHAVSRSQSRHGSQSGSRSELSSRAQHAAHGVTHDASPSRRVAERIQDNQRSARASRTARGTSVNTSAGMFTAGSSSYASAVRSGSRDRYAAALGESGQSPSEYVPQRSSGVHSSQSAFNARVVSSAHQSGYQSTRRPFLAQAPQKPAEEEEAHLSPAREKAQRAQNKTFAQELRKRFRSAKADRAFEKTVGAQDRASASQGASQGESSRAAMYEMRMGATHRKSARMQDKNQRSSKSPGSIARFAALPQAATRVLAVLVVAVFAVALLYPSCASYYQEVRQLQQLQAEYDAIESYNAQMQASIDYLNTDEGIEDYARSELGWIRSGEKMATVEGVEVTSSDNTDDILYAVSEESISAPDTWYSGVLDVLFGYRG